MTEFLDIHRHNWKYSYVRGRKDKFEEYPFPVWVAIRSCSCGEREVLVPFRFNFNSGKAEWMREVLTHYKEVERK